MKAQLLESIEKVDHDLRELRKQLKKLTSKNVSQASIRQCAEDVASAWVENLRSPLEHKVKIDPEILKKYSDLFKHLHVLSRPSNRTTSYLSCVEGLLKNFKNEIHLPVLQLSEIGIENRFLATMLSKMKEDEVSDYLREAMNCAQKNFYRAAIVLGWCAVIDCIQQKILREGFNKFNETSKRLKEASSGRFKRYSKEFKVTTLSELQEVFDNDLLWMVEGMSFVDANQAERLRTCFQWRNNSAHPGHAPIAEVHLNAFFSDTIEIVLSNPIFTD